MLWRLTEGCSSGRLPDLSNFGCLPGKAGGTPHDASDPGRDVNPVWSADGQELIFGRLGKTNDVDIFRTGLRSGATAAPLVESPGDDYPEEWTRDGEFLLFVRFSQVESSLWALPVAGEGPLELVVKAEGFHAREPQLSPDGRWLAYVSNESGEWEVYVEPFRRPGETVRVSVDGGTQPRWRADGRELFYRRMTGPLMAVEIREDAESLEVGLPTELFAAGLLGSSGGDHYAVSADGQRFLVKVPIDDDSKFQMHVVLNWESLLDQSGE
jgi:Tol biopolymer transport system component